MVPLIRVVVGVLIVIVSGILFSTFLQFCSHKAHATPNKHPVEGVPVLNGVKIRRVWEPLPYIGFCVDQGSWYDGIG